MIGVGLEIAVNRCKFCGCTESKPCGPTDEGEFCAWINEEKNVCSFCAMRLMQQQQIRSELLQMFASSALSGLCANPTLIDINAPTVDLSRVTTIALGLGENMVDKLYEKARLAREAAAAKEDKKE